MGRSLTSGFASAIAAGSVQPVWLLELGFASGTDYLCGLDFDVTWSGNTYLAAYGMVAVSGVEETEDSVQGLQVQIMGASSANLALALTERVQGRPLVLRMAVIDAAGALQVDANVWSGRMDTLSFDGDADAPVVTLTAEHMLVLWDQPITRRYTHAEQQAQYPDDMGLEYVATTSQADLVWPGKAFFQQEG